MSQKDHSKQRRFLSLRKVGNLVKVAGRKFWGRRPRAITYSKACSLAQSGNAKKLTKFIAKEKANHAKHVSTPADGNSEARQFFIDDYDEKTGLNPLHIACNTSSLDICKILVEAKADVRCKSRGKIYAGWTPLHFAFRRNAKEICSYLLEAKANPTVRTDKGILPEDNKIVWEEEQMKKAKIRKVRLLAIATKKTERKKLGQEKFHSKICQAVKARSIRNIKRIIDSRPPPNLDECERSTGFAAIHYAAGE